VIINVIHKTQNKRLELMGKGNCGKTRRLMRTGPGLASEESAGQVFGRVRNRTKPFLRSKPGPLAGYLDPLLTLTLGQQLLQLCLKYPDTGTQYHLCCLYAKLDKQICRHFTFRCRQLIPLCAWYDISLCMISILKAAANMP
jgi:hypothetical protein